MSDVLTDDTTGKTYEVDLTQSTDGWQNTADSTGLSDAGMVETNTPLTGGKATLAYVTDSKDTNYQKVTITYSK